MSVAKRSVAVAVIFVVTAVALGWVWLNRQYLQDWQAVRAYESTAEIQAVTRRASMSDKGQFLFYASQPAISQSTEFNQQCNRSEATTAILGCYSAGRIYIYQVDTAELDGVIEVTAAHEMLHAAWDRMSDGEQQRLGQHLEQVYAKVKSEELAGRLEYYERKQPGERSNELHSILATEVAMLDETLEQHYAQYFVDRQAIVRLHSAYEAVFTALKDQSELLRGEVEGLLAHLNADVTAFNTSVTRLEAEIATHNSQSAAVDSTNTRQVAAYNARQAALMARRAQLGREELVLDERRTEFSQKVQEYNDLTVRSATLVNSLDSLKAPPKAVQ